jgi:hypothetical protein
VVKGLLLSVILLSAGHASGQTDPESWYKQLVEKNNGQFPGVFPAAFVMVKKLPAKGEVEYLGNVDAAAFNKLGFFKIANWRNADWNFKLNRAKFEKLDARKVIYDLTGANTIVAAEKKRWKFYQGTSKKPLATIKAPKSDKAAVVSEWLIDGLGWDGVVLDQKGDELLVGSTSKILAQPEIQALAIANSEKKFLVTAKERKGSGLLSLQKISGGLGVFDVVFLGAGIKKLAPGTKLIIEKKKK